MPLKKLRRWKLSSRRVMPVNTAAPGSDSVNSFLHLPDPLLGERNRPRLQRFLVDKQVPVHTRNGAGIGLAHAGYERFERDEQGKRRLSRVHVDFDVDLFLERRGVQVGFRVAAPILFRGVGGVDHAHNRRGDAHRVAKRRG